MWPRSLGMGCAFLRSEKEAVEALHCAIDLGINYVDTAPLYGDSERLVGLGLEGGWRDRVYLQTKTGAYPDGSLDYSGSHTRSSVENSLRRLKTDYLDAVLVHEPLPLDEALGPDRALEELLKMKDEGLLGYTGFGTRSHDDHIRAMETGDVDIALTYLDYTLVDQSAGDTVLVAAREHGVAVILASILGMGRLTGLKPDVEGAEDPVRAKRALAMWQWCGDRGVNVRHLAMQFGLAAPSTASSWPVPRTASRSKMPTSARRQAFFPSTTFIFPVLV